MRGIFVESLRGALVRLLRTFIMIVIILLIVFIIGLFHQEKVHALVYKGSIYSTYDNVTNTSGSIGANTNKYISWGLNNYQFDKTKDYLAFQFNIFDISYTKDSVETFCTKWSPIGSAPNLSYQCSSYVSSGNMGYGDVTEYSSSINVFTRLHYMVNNVDYWSPCTYNSDESLWYCTIDKSYGNPDRFDLSITNGQWYDNVRYNFDLTGWKYYYNNDSTEIVSGLTGVQQQQQNTTQAIEDLTKQQEQSQQYIENNNVTSSQTQFQGGVSDLSQQINAQISGVNDLTQIVLLPVTLFMDLSTGTCTPLHLVVPFTNNEIDLPCMKPIYEEHFNGLLTIFSTIVCAVTTYWVSVNSAKLIKEILDCDNDRIEVIDL